MLKIKAQRESPMKLESRIRAQFIALLSLALFGVSQVAADDGFPDAEFWKYRLEDVGGAATFKLTNRKLTIEMPGKTLGFGNYREGTLRVAGKGDDESKSTSDFFTFFHRYKKGVHALDLDGHKAWIEDEGKTLRVARKKIKVDDTRDVKVTIRANGTIDVQPKEALLP